MTYLVLGYGVAVIVLGSFLTGSLIKLRRSR
jgi:hypothetical protein